MNDPARSKPLVLPPDLPYQCRGHGDCCREDWNIPIDTESLAALKRQLEQSGENSDCFEARSGETTFRRDHGACVFQGEDHRCTVHARWGVQTKPLVCRQFPYLFIETPDAVEVGYSFVCRSVREEHAFRAGQPDANPEDLPAIYQLSLERDPRFHVFQAPDRIALDGRRDLPWAAYRPIRDALIDLLNEDGAPLADRLAAGHVFINLTAEAIRQGVGTEAGDAAMTDAVNQIVEKLSADGFARVLRIAAHLLPAMAIGRFVRALYLTVDRIRLLRLGGRRVGRLSSVQCYLAALSAARRPRLTEAQGQTLDRFAQPWLRHGLRRHGLALETGSLFGGDLRRRYANLLVAYALVRHYFASLVRDLPSEEAASEAIRKVERDFVLHSGLSRIRQTDEAFGPVIGLFLSVLNRAYEQKSFPRSILG